MATYRPVPAKIMTIDYVGISTAASEVYRKRAEQELSKLEGQVLRGKLDRGDRLFNLGDNVKVECTVCFNLKQATVVIGADAEQSIEEKPCYCCSPCLVAGRISKLSTMDQETLLPVFEEEQDYFADIIVCQAADSTAPKSIVLYEERRSGGAAIMSKRVLQSRTFEAVEMFDVAFADFQNHQVGDSVLVLVQPLYGFTPYAGEYLACVNRGQVVNESVENDLITISLDYPESTGYSCQIVSDSQVWDMEEEDLPDIAPDPKYFPFRILPIKIESCL